jgi:acyl-CoA thioesterase-2
MNDTDSNTMNAPLAFNVKLLELKKINDTTFEGIKSKTNNERIYGGQVVSQALMAASATVEGRPAISLKSDFLRAGDPNQTIIFKVENVRDGRSFNTRRVVATQTQKGKEQITFILSASFHKPEDGVQHQIDMANYPKPLDLPSSAENWERIKDKIPDYAKEWYESERAFEERPIKFNDPVNPEKRDPHHAVWFKANGTVDRNNAMHQGLFAYISDMCLLDSCIMPHGISWMKNDFQSASLDHSIWFHREFRVDEWMLFVCDSPISYGARGFNRASVYRENGDLIASVTQEGLIRI